MPSPSSLRHERAILVGICRTRLDRPEVEEHLEELGRLAETAGARVVGTILQERGAISPPTLLRPGKVEALAALARERDADLAVCDDDLSPAQVRNLEKAAGVKVLDRSALILDIFARRARTREARTQVELAQLRYLLPRLTRAWTHLSRQEGGIGQRGVGETQLELDRRIVRRRIARLARDLGGIEQERGERRKRRADRCVALVGYTNAGKSTLMNALTGADSLVEDRLFATLDPLVRRAARGGPPAFLVIDTVGFIRKLPHHLVASFRSTLEEAAEADLLLHVADASAPALQDQMRAARAALEDLGLGTRPSLMVFNKVDRTTPVTLDRLRTDHPEAAFVSALDPADVRALERRVRALLALRTRPEPVPLPPPADEDERPAAAEPLR